MKFSRKPGLPSIPPLRMRRTPPMPAEQRPRPNTRVANSSGPSGNQKRSTPNSHSGWKRLTWTKTSPTIGLEQLSSRHKRRALSLQPKIKASQNAGINPTSSRLTWIQNADCVTVSMRPLAIWSLAFLNCLKLYTNTATKRQLRTCIGRSVKSLVLRWKKNGLSMNPRLPPRRTASPFCGTWPSTLTRPSQLIGRTLC